MARFNTESTERDEDEFADDPRPIVDTKLEWEADQSGMIHLRKHRSETTVLPGYGITDFGVSAYETKKVITPKRVAWGAGIAAAGVMVWNFKDTLVTYALLLRESTRS